VSRNWILAVTVLLIAQEARGQGSPTIVISQLYGGGGNSGSTLRNDFIELFNRGNTAVNVAGWSVQYASAAGTSWDRTLLSGTIAPGQYYLLQEAEGSGGSSSLPSSDANGGINLSATSGKVALVSNSNVLTGSSPAGLQIIDFVGYGTANFAEGKPTDALSNTAAAIRRSSGCADTNNNQADFSIGGPNPRNSRSPMNVCGGGPAVPQISESGITNAASFLPGPVAPGEIVVISGSGFGTASPVMSQLTPDGQYLTKSLASTRVLFDGVAAPMVGVSANQVSTIVPFGTVGRSSTSVQLEYNGVLSNKVTLALSPSAPGVFTVNSTRQGNILNQDLSVNSDLNPAPRGSVVTIYATGAGQTIPAGDDGRVIGNEAPKPILPVAVRIGGVEAELLSVGAVSGRVSGFLQIRARVPDGLTAFVAADLTIIVGDKSSQAGVIIAVAAPPTPDGVGPLVDEKLQQLKSSATVSSLQEIPNDRSLIPGDWLALVSWNLQVGGTSVAPDAQRPAMVQAALSSLFTGTYQLVAAQEVPSTESAQLLRTLLPGGTAEWQTSFFNTSDTIDNGFWYRTGTTLRDSFPLFVTDETDSSGRIITDRSRSVHPPQVAQFEVGDFDFTLLTVHLTFAGGDTSESLRELRGILDYLDWYFSQPDHDPDVIVCGDFNTPSALSGQTGKAGITLDAVFDQDPRFQTGERRFVVTVHEPTSRGSAASGGLPVSNYDHCVLSANTMKSFVQARRVSTDILTDHPDDPEVRLTSDHFPIVAFFKTRGDGISLDRKRRIRPY
jgi:uncharacterized protein (TIGR03437 family)